MYVKHTTQNGEQRSTRGFPFQMDHTAQICCVHFLEVFFASLAIFIESEQNIVNLPQVLFLDLLNV